MHFSRYSRCSAGNLFLLLLTTGLVIWFSGAATAHVVVSAPTPASAHKLDIWYQHHIPACYQAHSRLSISVLTDGEMDAYLGQQQDASSHAADDGDGDIDGVFESDPDRITVRAENGDSPDNFTFAHEYGHYVWFHILTSADRHRYEKLYDHQRAAQQLVTHYAATDVQEGFAEAFSFYVCEPLLLKYRDPLSSQFLVQLTARS